MTLKQITLLFFTLCITFVSKAEQIELTIKGIRSNKGSILIGIYKDNSSFLKEVPFKKIKVLKANLKDGVLKCSINLPTGKFGFAMLDDENSNKEMDDNFFGIPEEGYGFSNYDHTGIFRPDFSDFSFYVKAVVINRVNINVDYF